MKHKVKVMVEVEKSGLFGKKKVLEERAIVVDGKNSECCWTVRRSAPHHR